MPQGFERLKIRAVRGRVIEIDHLELPKTPTTMLTAAAAAGATSFTVLDTAGFADNQLMLIGTYGSEGSEILEVNGAVSAGTTLPSGTTIFAHAAGTPIQRVLFDQILIYGTATNVFATTNLVATVDIDPTSDFTTHVNPDTEYAFYFAVTYDSVNAVTGADPEDGDGVASATGYVSNSVGNLIYLAQLSAHSELRDNYDSDWAIREINDCLRDMLGRLKRWSTAQVFDYALGQTARGTYAYTLPTDIWDPNTIKSILDVRIGGEAGLTYQDKKEWEDRLEDVNLTTVRTQAVSGDTTLEVDNSYDFTDSGAATAYISGTQDSFAYTGVTRSTTAGEFTGITASGDDSIENTFAVDTNIWQNEDEGTPQYFTVYDGTLYIWPLPDGNYDNMNVYLDYYTEPTEVDSYGDIIPFPRFDAVKHWLTWKLRSQLNERGKPDISDGDFQLYERAVQNMIKTHISGQKHKQVPKYNTVVSTSSRSYTSRSASN